MEKPKKYFNLSDDVNLDDIYYMNPVLLSMIIWVSSWCDFHDVIPFWTSFHRPENDGISKSRTHQEFRAADLSLLGTFGWTTDKIDEFRYDFHKKFESVGAVVFDKENNEYTSRPIYIHGKGKGIHAHLQIRPNLQFYKGEKDD